MSFFAVRKAPPLLPVGCGQSAMDRLLTSPTVVLDPLGQIIATEPQHEKPLPLPAAAPSEPPGKPLLYTVEEVATHLKVSAKTIRRRIKDGTIRTAPIGGRLRRISADELQRLIAGPVFEP